MFIVTLKFGKDIGIQEMKKIDAERYDSANGVTIFSKIAGGKSVDIYSCETSVIERIEDA